MQRYYITDSGQAGGLEAVRRHIRRAVEDGVEWIQIRENELPAGRLLELVEEAVAVARGTATRIVVNSRLDVALAGGASGLHLRSDAPAPSRFRSIVPEGFLIGVSCHSAEELGRAEREGADYALLSPVREVPGKGAALGWEIWKRSAAGVRLPIFALGGLTWEDEEAAQAAGAAGMAGIRLFQSGGRTNLGS